MGNGLNGSFSIRALLFHGNTAVETQLQALPRPGLAMQACQTEWRPGSGTSRSLPDPRGTGRPHDHLCASVQHTAGETICRQDTDPPEADKYHCDVIIYLRPYISFDSQAGVRLTPRKSRYCVALLIPMGLQLS